jgi:hypothetical protein
MGHPYTRFLAAFIDVAVLPFGFPQMVSAEGGRGKPGNAGKRKARAFRTGFLYLFFRYDRRRVRLFCLPCT